MINKQLRVGVLFGGRSSEHEVSLASARNVIDALQKAGHLVMPMGITPGRWLTTGDPLALLTGETVTEQAALLVVNGHNGAHEANKAWALLPQASQEAPLPAIDVIFPVLHGPYGEDGTVQGLLEMANLPYVGAGVLASAVAMDKVVARLRPSRHPTGRLRMVMRKRWQKQPAQVVDEVETQFSYPVFVKPANLGGGRGEQGA